MRESYHAAYLPVLPHLGFSPSYIPGIFFSSYTQINSNLSDDSILGSDMAVLSAAPLRCPLLARTDTVPFTSSLMEQHGEPVHCIPFSTSPFSVLDITRSYSSSLSMMINEDLSINLSSVKTNLVKESYSLMLVSFIYYYRFPFTQPYYLYTWLNTKYKEEQTPPTTCSLSLSRRIASS